MKKIHTVYIAGLFILILGIGATWVINKADQAHQTPPPIIKSVPDFQFKTHDGYTFTMENFRNKINSDKIIN